MKPVSNPKNEPLGEALRACRRHFAAAAAFSALLNLLYLAPTLYMLQVYDRVVPTRGVTTLGFLTLAMLLALATLASLDAVRSRLLVRASVRLDRRLAGLILDAAFSRRAEHAPAVARQAMRDFDVLRQTLTGAGMLALFDAPWTPIYVLACFLLHPVLGAIALVGALALTGLTWLNDRATRHALKLANEASAQAYVAQEDAASRAEVVRALGLRRALVGRLLDERAAASGLQAEASFAGSGYLVLTRFARLSLQSLALGAGAWLAIRQEISAGSIFAASFLIARSLAPTEQVLAAWRSLTQARSAWRNLATLLGPSAAPAAPTVLPRPSGRVEVEGIVVLSPDRERALLEGVTLAAAPGEIIGVLGPNGAGKSTLLRAIVGAAHAERGVVRIDGAAIGDYEPERLAACIGYMPQDPSLFRGTVKENIARFDTQGLADGEVDARAIEAARLAHAHEMILRLPKGYDTRLGLGGAGLSAGQAQAISLARALYRTPSILALDEPNAHMDAEAELQLLRTLEDLKAQGGAVFMVSHRPGVIGAFDKLLILRDGRVEAFGPREEILRRVAPGRPGPKPASAPGRAAPSPVRAPTDFLRLNS